jgi:hypothetical protein
MDRFNIYLDPRFKKTEKSVLDYLIKPESEKLNLVLDLDETLLNTYIYDSYMGGKPLDNVKMDAEFIKTISFVEGSSVKTCQVAVRP